MPEVDKIEIIERDKVYNIFIWKNGELVFSGLTRNLEINGAETEIESEDLAAFIEDEMRYESIELSNLNVD